MTTTTVHLGAKSISVLALVALVLGCGSNVDAPDEEPTTLTDLAVTAQSVGWVLITTEYCSDACNGGSCNCFSPLCAGNRPPAGTCTMGSSCWSTAGGTAQLWRCQVNNNTWSPTGTTGVPAGRDHHTAVWTGSRMVVWGGYSNAGGAKYMSSGGQYDPSTRTWTSTSATGAPSGRMAQSAVWTGSEMIVWGGKTSDTATTKTGALYNPSTNTWRPMSTTSAPSARYDHAAFWTGSEMIVWEGFTTSGAATTGGRYNPATDTWRGISTTGAVTAGAAVWTGSEMIVFSGNGVGGRYNPTTNKWTKIAAGGPTGGKDIRAAWSGSQMLVWDQEHKQAGRYTPATNTWSTMSVTGAPTTPMYEAAWTGSDMILWGGEYDATNAGYRYSPSTDTWTSTTTNNAPSARTRASLVWTGQHMIVWGGESATGTFLTSGGAYTP